MSRLSLLRMALALVVAFASHAAHAFAVISSEADFALLYQNPTTVVALKSPAPSSYRGIEYSLGGGATAQEIDEGGWSPLFNIGSLSSGQCCWAAATWYGSEVSPSIYERPENFINRLYIALLTPSPVVVALRTDAGFFGLVPDGTDDMFFGLPVDARLSEVTLGYSKVAAVPEPGGEFLALAALAALYGTRRRPVVGAGRAV